MIDAATLLYIASADGRTNNLNFVGAFLNDAKIVKFRVAGALI